MTNAPVPPKNVADIILNMEDDVRDAVSWAQALSIIGNSPSVIQASTIHVMANALLDLALRLEEQWEQAFVLTHSPDDNAAA